jgi:ribonuclease HI
MDTVVYCDGGARGNPGPAAAAFVVKQNGKNIFQHGQAIGVATNNIAEYTAVLLSLRWLSQNKIHCSSLTYILDSELVTKQLNGDYKIKNDNLKTLAIEIREALKIVDIPVTFKHVKREFNKDADSLVNKTLDEQIV